MYLNDFRCPSLHISEGLVASLLMIPTCPTGTYRFKRDPLESYRQTRICKKQTDGNGNMGTVAEQHVVEHRQGSHSMVNH